MAVTVRMFIMTWISQHLWRIEKAVLRLLLMGKTSEQLAETLSITRHTVKYHTSSILKKAHVHSRAELWQFFFETASDTPT